jgi:peptidyl-prolyl cis-trans isomerase C
MSGFLIRTAFWIALVLPASSSAFCQEKPVALVNGAAITETDIELALTDLGSVVGQLPPDKRRQAVIEYLIECQLLADAAEQANLGTGAKFEAQLRYARRRVLRDQYFDARVLARVGENDARQVYDEQFKSVKPEEEIRVRHILVDSEDRAADLRAKIIRGNSFTTLAREASTDRGSSWNGGDLGYFIKGQMDEDFERAAFALKKEEVSKPVKTQFGWHLIILEDRRMRPVPEYESMKHALINLLVHRKAQETIVSLREKAKVEILNDRPSDLTAKQPEPTPRQSLERQTPGTAIFDYGKSAPEYTVSSPQLNLRSAPNPNSDVLAKLEIGSRGVFALGEAKDYEEERWIKVKVGSDVGWVNDRYVRPVIASNVAIDRKEGHELDGNAYRVPTADSYNECMHACLMDDRCRAMEFDQKDKSNLFKSVPNAKRSNNVDSGIKRVISQ